MIPQTHQRITQPTQSPQRQTSHSLHAAASSPVSATFRCWLCGIHLTYLCDQKNAPRNLLILQSALARKKLPNSKTLNGLIHTTDNAGGNILSSLNPMNLTKPITNPRKRVIKLLACCQRTCELPRCCLCENSA